MIHSFNTPPYSFTLHRIKPSTLLKSIYKKAPQKTALSSYFFISKEKGKKLSIHTPKNFYPS